MSARRYRHRLRLTRWWAGALAAAHLLGVGCGDRDPDPAASSSQTAEVAASSPPADVGAAVQAPVAPPPVGQEPKVDEVPPVPPTDLPLILLATMVADDEDRRRATVRNEQRDAIATYRIGDAVATGATLVAVDRDFVLLERDGEQERLDFPPEPTPLTGGETFYLDLVDLDARANTMDEVTQLVDGPGYMVKTPAHAWGTPRTVAAIGSAAMIYVKRGLGGPQIHVGDISRREGGPFPPHLSHQDGRDVDVGYVLQGPDADVTRFRTATRHRLDLERSWALLRAFLETERVRYMFVDYGLQRLFYEHALANGESQAKLDLWFQYPAGSAANRGVIRHWRGHANHFHVRFEP